MQQKLLLSEIWASLQKTLNSISSPQTLVRATSCNTTEKILPFIVYHKTIVT